MSRLGFGLVRLLGLLVVSILVAACAGGGEEQSGTTSTSLLPVAAGEGVAECGAFGYPCGLAETPDLVWDRMRELSAAAGERLVAGSMADALAFLAGESDEVTAAAGETVLMFRVEGGPPMWLVDQRNLEVASPPTGMTPPQFVPVSIVGEDTTNDGVIDNRDSKRALVLAPYLWEFGANDEAEAIAERLRGMPGYRGNVKLYANRSRDDQEVTLDHFGSFGDYDVVFVSSHGERLCVPWTWGEECNPDEHTQSVVRTGVRVPPDNVRHDLPPRAVPVDVLRSTGPHLTTELGIGLDFVSLHYPGGLDNTLVVLSACETGGDEGESLADRLGQDKFVMMGWTDTVDSWGASQASLSLLNSLSLGLTTEEAFSRIPYAFKARVNRHGRNTDLRRFAPGGGDVRLIELPVLMNGASPMTDGTVIADRVVPGPGGEESLKLDLRVRGVDAPSRFKVRYEIDGAPTSSAVYDLTGGSHDPDLFQYDVTHEVELDFDLPTEPFELRAVVDLPEGGESTYSVLVTRAYRSCEQVIGDDIVGIWNSFRSGAAVPNRTHTLDRGPSFTYFSQCLMANETGELTIMTWPGRSMERNYTEFIAPGGLFGHDDADGIRNFHSAVPAPSVGEAIVFFGGTWILRDNVDYWWLVFQVGDQEWWVRGAAPGLVADDVISVGEWLIERMRGPGDRDPGDDPPDGEGPPGDT